MKRSNDLRGKTYGQISVLTYSHVDKGGNQIYNCKCSCGKELKRAGSNLKRSAGIGCVDCKNKRLQEEKTTHGLTYSRLYVTWRGMKSRCSNPLDQSYKNYGAKGISVCDDWERSFESFM